MSPDKTLKYILKNNCSISRFGDGEFDLIFQNRDLGFQNKSDEISDALSKVLSIKNYWFAFLDVITQQLVVMNMLKIFGLSGEKMEDTKIL